MLGIVVILVISWVFLHFLEKESIIALGILPSNKRLKQFGIGFLVAGLLCLGVQVLEAILLSSQWSINSAISLSEVINMIAWDARSVVTEELIFRGAILYILISKLGNSKGILISSIAFGIYHWFSYGIFGAIVPMIVVFFGTGLMGYGWALAFSKTKSVAMPIGLHLGWNFTLNTIFSKGPLGSGILISQSDKEISDWFSLIGLWIVPILVLLYVKYLVAENTPSADKHRDN